MKHLNPILRLFCLSAILGPAAMADEPACSAATVKGTYTFQTKGSILLDGYVYFFASVGKLKADGAGSFTVKDTSSTSGVIERRRYGGTYAVAEDCTGSATMTIGGTAYNFDIVLAPDGKTVQLIQTDAGITSSGEAKLDIPPQP